MDFMPMPSRLSPIACGGIGVSIPTVGGDIPIMVGAAGIRPGTTLGIGVEAGLGTIRTGITRIGAGAAVRIIGAMLIRLAALMEYAEALRELVARLWSMEAMCAAHLLSVKVLPELRRDVA